MREESNRMEESITDNDHFPTGFFLKNVDGSNTIGTVIYFHDEKCRVDESLEEFCNLGTALKADIALPGFRHVVDPDGDPTLDLYMDEAKEVYYRFVEGSQGPLVLVGKGLGTMAAAALGEMIFSEGNVGRDRLKLVLLLDPFLSLEERMKEVYGFMSQFSPPMPETPDIGSMISNIECPVRIAYLGTPRPSIFSSTSPRDTEPLGIWPNTEEGEITQYDLIVLEWTKCMAPQREHPYKAILRRMSADAVLTESPSPSPSSARDMVPMDQISESSSSDENGEPALANGRDHGSVSSISSGEGENDNMHVQGERGRLLLFSESDSEDDDDNGHDFEVVPRV